MANAALLSDRAAIYTVHPFWSKTLQVAFPIPVLEPVMIATRPVWSGKSETVKVGLAVKRGCWYKPWLYQGKDIRGKTSENWELGRAIVQVLRGRLYWQASKAEFLGEMQKGKKRAI